MRENELAKEFHEAMIGIYKAAVNECKYRPTRFLQMVTERGGVEAAKVLNNAPKVSEGFTRLWECGRLDLTVEAYAIKPKFARFFAIFGFLPDLGPDKTRTKALWARSLAGRITD